MEKFQFYQDELVTIWKRSTFEVEANSREEAIEKIKQLDFKRGDLDEVGSFKESEFLFETEKYLEPDENHASTFEIEEPDTGDTIYSNAW